MNKVLTAPLLKWLIGDDTGISSRTIVSAIYGVEIEWANVPLDPSDFGRCHRLVMTVPEIKENMHLVAEKYPQWGPFLREWDRMTILFLRDKPTGKSRELYDLMQALEAEGKKL